MNEERVAVSLNPICCNGCGGCAEMYPDIFGFDPATEKAFVKALIAPREDAEKAAALCPRDCIEVEG